VTSSPLLREFTVVFDLLPAAYMGAVASSALDRDRGKPGISGVLNTLATGYANSQHEREWRITMALALRQLPPGMCVVGRDTSGREWFIGPAVIAKS
jgi:hypothetical protein